MSNMCKDLPKTHFLKLRDFFHFLYHIDKCEKYCHSIKVGTLGGHNPLCLKSYKIRTPMKNFKKPNFNMKLSGFSEIRTHDPRFTIAILYHRTIFTKGNCSKNCSL